ncbi:hypothetical protein [Arcobacter porcinus]|uniref:Uncharacterized protein n=1 Tax=Arcobacter porcinus TaxID=1935204 RepID=A0A5C2HBU3_9BACT|nr:hypothetical protein [Arcobacter porcinus]OCL97195.1 hypothetical protein AAX27_00102 [Aliarcobacter thereius]QEP39805.1 hypothetical protein APORC_0166 [Arcobacter porcinus]
MYQTMISEVAKNKLENFKPSFDEINKKMSPNELLNKSQEVGISGDKTEIEGIDSEVKEKTIIKNKEDGLEREKLVYQELKEEYPQEDGYKIESEIYLRDKDGNIVKDPITGEARRIDFVVIKDGKVVKSIEVTSKTADKTAQSAKEDRIRENGGNFIKDSEGNLVEIPNNVKTVIVRKD